MTVAPDSVMVLDNFIGSMATARLTITTRPPSTNGKKSSKTAISKDIVVTASSTSRSVNPGSCFIESRRLSYSTVNNLHAFWFTR